MQVPEAYDAKYQQRKAGVELRARSADGAVQPLIEGRLGDSGAEGLPGDARCNRGAAAAVHYSRL